jgi:hypothetical protein
LLRILTTNYLFSNNNKIGKYLYNGSMNDAMSWFLETFRNDANILNIEKFKKTINKIIECFGNDYFKL